MTPSEMLDVRNKVEAAVKAIGAEITGAGTSLVEPQADFDMVLEGRRFNIAIVFRGAESSLAG